MAACLFQPGMLSEPRFVFHWSDRHDVCSECGDSLCVRASRTRHVVSLKHGRFVAIEKQGYCPQHRALPTVRSEALERIVPRGANVAYDMMVHIGLARFVQCRQLAEIQADVTRACAVELPLRTIGYQAQKFVAYIEVVHRQSIRLLRNEMAKRGGYILHIDGTCEEGSRVLLVCLDSLSGQVIESRKIASENVAEVAQVLKDVRRNWGVPLATVHDLRNSLITATEKAFPDVPQFVCHYHLAADVGKDILAGNIDSLRKLFRKSKVRPRLGALRRSLRQFATRGDLPEHVVSQILESKAPRELAEHATPELVKGTVHALASWILAFASAGEGYGFPFDMPYLVLYERIIEVHKVLDCASVLWPEKSTGAQSLRRLKDVLETVILGDAADEFEGLVKETKQLVRIFDRFRAALRICKPGGKNRRNDEGAPATLSPARHKAILKRLRTSLKRQAKRTPSTQKACKIVVYHIDKYWDYLFGHTLTKGPNAIVVPRTNNVEESLFRTIKRQCRRLHGRGHLSRDVDAMSAGITLRAPSPS